MVREREPSTNQYWTMLTEIYIEALDEELADHVWDAWDAGEIDDQVTWLAWRLIVGGRFTPGSGHSANIGQRVC